MKRLLLLTATFLFTACDFTVSSDTTPDVRIRTDKSEYTLERKTGIYLAPIRITIENRSDFPVYIGRQCGFAEVPARQIERVADVDLHTELNRVVCPLILFDKLPDPIKIDAGATYIDDFWLESLEQASAIPPVTDDHRIGSFQFQYSLHAIIKSLHGERSVDLDPGLTRTNVFQVNLE